MAENALQAFSEAEEKLRAGAFLEALCAYLSVVRAVPEHLRARFRIGDCLLNLKARDHALAVYSSLAWYGIENGQPLIGLVAIKMAALLDPTPNDVEEVAAELYSSESTRVSRVVDARPDRKLTARDPVGNIAGLSGQALVAAATAEAANVEAITRSPSTLPAIALFSYLEKSAFLAVMKQLRLRRFAAGNTIIEQGQPGDSFFILAEGEVDVSRRMGPKMANIARLRPGAVFGEMALVSKAPRTATAQAHNDCELLELQRSSLEDEAHKLASVTQALKEFTHERFLSNLTATSPIFKPFPRPIRTQIIKRFKDYPVDPGDELISEGEEGQGLFLILKGTVDVTKRDENGKPVSLAQLKEGDVFGEISLVNSSATTATVSAVTRGELLFLPKGDFKSQAARHPELLAELQKLTAERIQKTKDVLEGDDDDFVLIEDDDLIML